jgi:hypothetical protein
MENLFSQITYLLAPLVFLALPGTAASLLLAVLGLATKSRTILLMAVSCSAPLLLYVLMGSLFHFHCNANSSALVPTPGHDARPSRLDNTRRRAALSSCFCSISPKVESLKPRASSLKPRA